MVVSIWKNKNFQRLGGGLVVIILIAVALSLIYYYTNTNEDEISINTSSVVTNGHGCAQIGIDVLNKGGKAADAAIASLFCEGVSSPQSCGLGGGFLLTIYNKATGEVWSLNSREVAPAAATENMFKGNEQLSQKGGLSSGVPGELVGYWYLYERFGGGVPWKELVQPTIDLCTNGIYVSRYLAKSYKGKQELLYADPVLREIYINPSTNETYVEGEYVKNPRLARTLAVIAEEGGYALHNGSLTEGFVADIKAKGGVITAEDMRNYRPVWQTPITTTLLRNESLYSAPLPGSGVILAFMLNMLSNFVDITEPYSITTYQRIVETFKFGYGQRTQLGDQEFVPNMRELVENLKTKSFAEEIRKKISDTQTSNDPLFYGANTTQVEDHGTAHISVLAPNGDAVAVTTTINLIFGAGFASESTGIILNDEMDDFSSPNLVSGFNIPPSPANYIVPGKRPLSSMCPTIVLDENKDVILVIGAAGGTKITTVVAQIILKHLYFGLDITTALNDKRFHHQLFPMRIEFEAEFNNVENAGILDGLRNIGHNYTISSNNDDGFASATSIARAKSGEVTATFDKRRPGSVSYISRNKIN